MRTLPKTTIKIMATGLLLAGGLALSDNASALGNPEIIFDPLDKILVGESYQTTCGTIISAQEQLNPKNYAAFVFDLQLVAEGFLSGFNMMSGKSHFKNHTYRNVTDAALAECKGASRNATGLWGVAIMQAIARSEGLIDERARVK